MHMCCLFFKQKTAYEMRISDWISDVCSSDLFSFSLSLSVPGELVLKTSHTHTHISALGACRRRGEVQHRNIPHGLVGDAAEESALEPARLEIGRASSRVRVCQYG